MHGLVIGAIVQLYYYSRKARRPRQPFGRRLVAGAGAGALVPKPAVSANAMAYFAQPINYDMDRFDVGGAYST